MKWSVKEVYKLTCHHVRNKTPQNVILWGSNYHIDIKESCCTRKTKQSRNMHTWHSRKLKWNISLKPFEWGYRHNGIPFRLCKNRLSLFFTTLITGTCMTVHRNHFYHDVLIIIIHFDSSEKETVLVFFLLSLLSQNNKKN